MNVSAFGKHKGTKDGLYNICSVCRRKRYPPKVTQEHNLRKFYGITSQDYDDMLARQGGVCAICKAPPAERSYKGDPKEPRLYVDHCHTTGVIRGLLCPGCNTMLGHIEKRPHVTFEMYESYLEERKDGFIK